MNQGACPLVEQNAQRILEADTGGGPLILSGSLSFIFRLVMIIDLDVQL